MTGIDMGWRLRWEACSARLDNAQQMGCKYDHFLRFGHIDQGDSQ